MAMKLDKGLDDVLDDGTLRHIKESVNDSIADWITKGNLTTSVKRGLESVVAHHLGIRYDHSSRLTHIEDCQITGLLKDKVKERVDKYFEVVFEKFISRILESDLFLVEQIVDKMFDSFVRSAAGAAHEAQRVVARRFEEDITERVKRTLNDKLTGTALISNTDPADPDSFGGKLGDMVMRSLAKKMSAAYPEK